LHEVVSIDFYLQVHWLTMRAEVLHQSQKLVENFTRKLETHQKQIHGTIITSVGYKRSNYDHMYLL